MEIQIYSINRRGFLKEKRIINIKNYNYYECFNSQGISFKHKKNGRELELFTKEFYETFKEEYINDNSDFFKELEHKIYFANYIKNDDFMKLFNLYFDDE